MEAQLYDGTVLEFPDGTDPAVIGRVAKRETTRLRVQQARSNIQQNPAEYNSKSPEFAAKYGPQAVPAMENLAAGGGKFLQDLETGSGQRAGVVPESAVAQARQADAPLMSTKAGIGGNIGMGLLTTAPVLAIPGANTVAGAGIVGGALGYNQPTIAGESPIKNAAMGAASGAVGQKVGQVVGGALSSKIAQRAAAKAAPLSEAEQKVKDAVAAGFKLTPQQMQSGSISKVAASASGRVQLEREFSRKNAKLVNELAQEEIGLPRKPELDRPAIARKKAEAGKIYEKLSDLPDGQFDELYQAEVATIDNRGGGQTFQGDSPEIDSLKNYFANVKNFRSKDIVAKVKSLRSDGFKNQSKLRNPEENAKGFAQLRIADALENALERHADKLGKPGLVKELKDARVLLAKIHTVEDSIEGSDVSAKQIFNQVDGKDYIGGNFKKISDAFGSFDRSFQDVAKIRDHPFTFLDYVLGAGGIGGAAAGSGVGLPVAAAVASRPLTRAALGAPFLQRAMAQPSRPGTNALGLLRAGSSLAGPAGVVLPTYLEQQQ